MSKRVWRGPTHDSIEDPLMSPLLQYVIKLSLPFTVKYLPSVTRLGDLLDFGQLFKDFGNN